MHPSPLFRQDDEAALSALVAAHPFALLVGVVDGRPVAAHAPVLLRGRTLRFHLSRANALAPVLVEGGRVLAVVTGPHAYISPDWYGLDDQVPTWNYLSAEMEGPVAVLDEAGAATLLDDLSGHFEADLAPKPVWKRSKMTPGRFEAMLRGIIACEVELDRFEGIWKLGQHKPDAARAAVADALGDHDLASLSYPPR
jgi:transcriptional regulator